MKNKMNFVLKNMSFSQQKIWNLSNIVYKIKNIIKPWELSIQHFIEQNNEIKIYQN